MTRRVYKVVVHHGMTCGANLELGWIPVEKSVSLSDEVNEHDHVEIQVRVLPLAPEETIREWTRESLEKQGWTREPDGTLTKQLGAAKATLSPDASKVTIAVEKKVTVQVEAKLEERAPEESVVATAQRLAEAVLKTAKRALTEKRAETSESIREANIRTLTNVEPDVSRDIRRTVNEVTKRALEARASQLGEVEQSKERIDNTGAYELTITVKARS